MAVTPKRAAIQADVLRATEELLAGGASWADLGVERIASRAGISRTAFYFYFADKRELLMRLTEAVTAQLYAETDRWFSGERDPHVAIHEALVNIARIYREHAPLLRVIVEVATYDDDVAAFWRGVVDPFIEATRQGIERDQSAGLATDAPADATAFALVWMFERVFYQQIVQDRFSDEEIVEGLAGVFLRAVYGTR